MKNKRRAWLLVDCIVHLLTLTAWASARQLPWSQNKRSLKPRKAPDALLPVTSSNSSNGDHL